MGLLAKPLGWLLTWMYGIIGNYGLTLVILTVFIKALLYPVYYKSMKSTARLGELQPQIKEIQNKYQNDRAMMNQKTQELYQKEGVSTTGGCLPMIVQMIVIMGLFTLLRNPIAYINSDEMLIAVHESFLWIQDLAQPDKWILPLGAAVATYFATAMNSSQQNQAGQQGMNKIMKYLFPVMILWMARTYPAGLAIYWFLSQVIQIFYNLAFAQAKKKDQAKKNKGKRVRKTA